MSKKILVQYNILFNNSTNNRLLINRYTKIINLRHTTHGYMITVLDPSSVKVVPRVVAQINNFRY